MSNDPNPIPKDEGEREVAALRSAFGIPAVQNIAYAEVDVGTIQDESVAVSGRGSPAGTSASPTSRIFDTFDTPRGHDRGNDAEVKLLEAIARAIQPNAQNGRSYPTHTGTVRLYSHFTTCPSCDGVIAAFGEMFPNVALSTSDGT